MSKYLIKAALSLFVGLAGCSSSVATDPKAEPQAVRAARVRLFSDVQYIPPTDWTIETIQGGLLILAPKTEANWQANLFLEMRTDPEVRTLEASLKTLAENLKTRKKQFRVVSQKVETNSNGIRFGRIEYTSRNEDAPLVEWEIVAEVGDRRRLFISASSADSLRLDYQPIFAAFVDSLNLDAKK